MQVDSSDLVVMGAAIGSVLALCIGLFIFLVRKNPQRARKILEDFLSVEVQIALRITFDAVDFYTDSRMLFVNVFSAPPADTQDILVAWIVCYSVSAMVVDSSWGE